MREKGAAGRIHMDWVARVMADLEIDRHVYQRFFECVHCGLCLAQCPTYAADGNENDSPRGRIYLMRSLSEGRIRPNETVLGHLDLCLDCRACETACPSGVHYGTIIESVRGEIARQIDRGAKTVTQRVLEHFMYRVLPYPEKLDRWLSLARLAQTTGLDGFLRSSGLLDRLPPALAGMHEMLPALSEPCQPLPAHQTPEDGTIRARVMFFPGCIGESLFGPTNRATMRVLLANGCEVFCPPEQRCCGAIHYHGGFRDEALALARTNIDVFEPFADRVDVIVTNVAGCGAMLKEYAELLMDDAAYRHRAQRFAAKVRDISEFLTELPLRLPRRSWNVKVTYHEPCHLAHAQQIRSQPRELLKAISGIELVELPESDWCCGAAGTYGLTQPKMSRYLAERKLRNVDKTGAHIVATGNAGCLLQLMRHARRAGRELRFAHPVELLDEAYFGSSPSATWAR